MGWFIGISVICHAVFIVALVDLEFSRAQIPDYDVYEVSIVSSAPPSRQARTSVKASGAKKYVYRKGAESSSISTVKKDKALKAHAPELSPSEIEPIKPQETDALEDIPLQDKDDFQQQLGGYGQAGTQSASAGSPNPVGVWKSQVLALVESLWKTPPEISIMDMSLKTTYLLKISRTGELIDKRLLVSSGNSPFDRSVFLALSSATRFPVPPLVLIAGREAVEITMSFTPPKGAQ